jgi:hypothetical protein
MSTSQSEALPRFLILSPACLGTFEAKMRSKIELRFLKLWWLDVGSAAQRMDIV